MGEWFPASKYERSLPWYIGMTMPKAKQAQDIDVPLLTMPALRAVFSTWTRDMRKLRDIITRLEVWEDATMFDATGYLFAIDTLRNNKKGILDLIDVSDEWEVRPTYEQMLWIAERMAAMDRMVGAVVNDYNRDNPIKAGLIKRRPWNGPTRSGLVRRAP